MSAGFARARKPEEKAERRTHLLATARIMLEVNLDLHALSLTELARRAGMAKSNVYRYFETREAVLLALLWDEWTDWFHAVSADHQARKKTSPAPLVRYLARSLASRPLLCALTASLPSVMEHNLSVETIHTFKLASLEAFFEFGRFLEHCAPTLSAERYARLLHDAATIIAGLYPFTHPTSTAAMALESEALTFFRRDFATELERFMLALAHPSV